MAATDARVQIRTTKELKDAASRTFARMGLDLSSGVNLYLRQVVNDQEIPFRPSARTRGEQARYEAENHIGMTFDSVDDLTQELDDDDA
jgi:DNA-damage-inducible protein J